MSLLIGMMETSLIQTAPAFHNKIPRVPHADHAPSCPRQQVSLPWLFAAQPTALIAAHLRSRGLGSLQNPGG